MSEELKLQRTREQWARCEPKLMAQQSPAAIMYALQDAQRDIAALHRHADKLRAELSAIKGSGEAFMVIARRACSRDDAGSYSLWKDEEHATRYFGADNKVSPDKEYLYGDQWYPIKVYTRPPVVAEAEPVAPPSCELGYGHAGSWCGPRFNCWLDPRPRDIRKAATEQAAPPASGAVPVTRADAEQFLSDYHAEVWAAAEDEDSRVAYDDAGRDLAKAFLVRFSDVARAQTVIGAVSVPRELLARIADPFTSTAYLLEALQELRALLAKGVA